MSYEKIQKYSNYEELKFNEILTQMSCNTSQIKSENTNLLTSLLHTCFNIRDMIYTYSDYNEIISATGALERLYCKYNMEDIDTSDAHTKMELFIAIETVSTQVTEALNSRQMFEDKLHKMQIDFSSSITNSQKAPLLQVNSSKNSKYNQEQSCRLQTDPISVLWLIKYLIDHNLKRPDKKQLRLLSFWTNLSEKKLNDWFSKTYQNYIRKNDQRSAHKKLVERAIKIGRQLRRPNSLRTSKSSVKSKFNKNSPYERKL